MSNELAPDLCVIQRFFGLVLDKTETTPETVFIRRGEKDVATWSFRGGLQPIEMSGAGRVVLGLSREEEQTLAISAAKFLEFKQQDLDNKLRAVTKDPLPATSNDVQGAAVEAPRRGKRSR
jgi:hypothetical protein